MVTLAELGYPDAEIEPTATPVAVSTPFRVLSDEGVAVMQRTARATRAGNRIENVVRSGCYRSRWLRDLCLSPAVTEAMAGIYGAGVAPHTMPVHLGHLNYEPTNAVPRPPKRPRGSSSRPCRPEAAPAGGDDGGPV